MSREKEFDAFFQDGYGRFEAGINTGTCGSVIRLLFRIFGSNWNWKVMNWLLSGIIRSLLVLCYFRCVSVMKVQAEYINLVAK